jgi:thiol:disulfide interchange protein
VSFKLKIIQAMIKNIYLVVYILLVTPINAQQSISTSYSTGTGIEFVKNITWKQVQTRAKKEHKYIFIDCFTTWCGPCKLMEREVFLKKEVGDFYKLV